MDEHEAASGRRSRFDQKEPQRKPSRFDRRSRSPVSRRSETRGRSPISKGSPSEADKPCPDPAAAAAAAAARINAQLQSRRYQHADATSTQKVEYGPNSSSSAPSSYSASASAPRRADGEMYISDGDYIKDIEVNDLRNRYTLTKSSMQQMIKKETGADVTTRGSYYPNKNMATAANPPLYLHVTSTSKEGLEAAVAKIQELIQQELPQLVDERRFRRRDQEPQPAVERDEYGRRKWPEEKIPVGLELMPGFNLRAQIVGSGGSYVKHIQSETGCRVQIKGAGSGYLEVSTNRESEEDMFLHVTGPDPRMVEKGKELCEDLVANVRQQYEELRSRPPRHADRGGHGDHYRGGRSHDQSYGRPSSDATMASGNTGFAGNNGSSNATDWSQYAAQYYGNEGSGQDPYAAYGGYQNYVAWYQYYYQQPQSGQAASEQAAPGQTTVPPPPPSTAAPPPPPSEAPPLPPSASPPPAPPSYPPAPGEGGFNAVPPPPGL